MVYDKRNRRVTVQGARGGAYRLDDRLPENIDPLLRQILDYFLGHYREGGRVIRKAEIDPLAFHRALPKVWIYERLAKDEFICRLAGDDVRSMYDRPIVGCSLAKLIRVQNAPDVMAHHEAILSMPGIGYMTGRVYLQSLERFGIGERLLLPALGEDGVPRFIWGAASYHFDTVGQDAILEQPNRLLIPLANLSATPS
ncbi:PAS domain-containing protein [Oceanibaculum sp.]|uniref:PAS domain-containing protein n=1 Tax=Oceanibaculum sp. TaxID=1903597 RepID=UPI00258FE699|nr:PAS domain-containing protein [Oceanibaculum sp.]MCH2394552.1 PAS domain-containing protein [Oceanibaculum sp.]